MAFNVTEFRANLIGDGARPNLFQVTMTFPTYTNDSVSSGLLVLYHYITLVVS